jgi:hypothetical protein
LELEPDEEQQVETRSTRRREPRDASNPGPPSMTPPVVTVDGARRASRRTTGSRLTGSLGTAAEALAATWDLVAACKFVHAKKKSDIEMSDCNERVCVCTVKRVRIRVCVMNVGPLA